MGARILLDKVLGKDASEQRFLAVVSLLLVAKVLLARTLVLSHAFGPGAAADIIAVAAVVTLSYSTGGSLGRRALAVVSAVISVLLLVGVVYASYFEQLPNLRMLASAWQVGNMSDEMRQLLRPVHLLFVADLPFTLVLGFAFQSGWPSSARAATAGALSLVLVSGFTVSAAAQQPLDSIDCSYRLGMVSYQGASLVSRALLAQSPRDGKSLQAEIDRLTGHGEGRRKDGAPAPGSMRGKNLIMIQVEALQAGMIGARIDGQSVVPNLEKLVSSSTYYPNTYSQIGRGNTSDAEFVANTSLYPPMNEPASVAYGKKLLPALPRMLANQGYDTFTMHTNDVRFWNRLQLYPALGFSRYYDKSFFGTADFTEQGASDHVLFDKSLSVLYDEVESGRPFYAQIITISSHYPYFDAVPKGTLRLPEDVKATETGRYLETLSYTDRMLGEFLDDLEMTGVLDDAVLVVYGDHFGLRFDRDTELDRSVREQLYGHGYNRADFYNVPLIIRVPGQKPHVDESVVGQIDVMPTMADLFGLHLSHTPHFGKSVYEDSETLMTRPSSIPTYIDDYTIYLGGITNGEDRWYDPTSQEMFPGGRVPDAMDSTHRLIELAETYASGLPERLGATDEVGEVPFNPKNLPKSSFR